MPKLNFILVLACLIAPWIAPWKAGPHERKNPLNFVGAQNPGGQHVHDATNQGTEGAGNFAEPYFNGVPDDVTEHEGSAEFWDAPEPDGDKNSFNNTRPEAMVCGHDEFWHTEEQVCKTCPLCEDGQQLSEPCGDGHVPSKNLHCGKACGYYEYWDPVKNACESCPFCEVGQKLSEPCGNGHRPSENLHCVDCPETAPGYYSDGCTHMCQRCTICSQYHRDVTTPCTRGSNTICSSTCSEGYEMRKTLPRGGGNMFTCQPVEENGEKGESGHALRNGLLAFLCLVIVLTCGGVVVYWCCNRRAHEVIPQYVD